MTAHAGDAMSHALLSARLRAAQRRFCVPKIAIRIAAWRAALFIRKNRSIGHCMAAIGIRPGTEDAVPFHLRITCANLASCGDDFILQ
jgi:hypothetical protein